MTDRLAAVTILLVEDSPTDAELTRKALTRERPGARIVDARDGVEALAYLRKEPGYEESPEPDLILLDLNMPRMDGRELLRIVKNDSRLRQIPVVVLTTSSEAEDIRSAYSAGSNAYVVKPHDLKRFFEVIHDMDHFWFDVAMRPSGA